MFSKLMRFLWKRPEPVADNGKNSGILAIWSPKSNGATVVAAHLARVWATRGETLLLDLNLRRPQLAKAVLPEGEEGKGPGLDELWPLAQAGTLSPNHIRSSARRCDVADLYVVPGTKHPEDASERRLQPAEMLLRVAGASFRNVILDVAADLDNAATEMALRVADHILVVVQPTLLSLHQFEIVGKQIELLGIDRERLQIVVTGHHDESPYQLSEIARYCGRQVITVLPFVAELDLAVGVAGPVWDVRPNSRTGLFRQCLQEITWSRLSERGE